MVEETKELPEQPKSDELGKIAESLIKEVRKGIKKLPEFNDALTDLLIDNHCNSKKPGSKGDRFIVFEKNGYKWEYWTKSDKRDWQSWAWNPTEKPELVPPKKVIEDELVEVRRTSLSSGDKDSISIFTLKFQDEPGFRTSQVSHIQGFSEEYLRIPSTKDMSQNTLTQEVKSFVADLLSD